MTASQSSVCKYYSVKTLSGMLDIKESTIRKAMRKQPGEKGYLYSELVGLGNRRVPDWAVSLWCRGEWGDRVGDVVELRSVHG